MADPAAEDRLAKAIDQVYIIFSRYGRPRQVQLCGFCYAEEDLQHLRTTPLREIDAERTRQLIWETADHFDSEDLYKHYFPRILEGLAPPIRCDDLYPEHLFETMKAQDFSNWPSEERGAFWTYVVAVENVLKRTDAEAAIEWRRAAGRLTGSPYPAQEN